MEEDWIEKYKLHLEQENQNELKKNHTLIDGFIEYCKAFDVYLTIDNFEYVQTIGIVASYPEILKKLAPTITFDKENLVNWNNLTSVYSKKSISPGYLNATHYIIMMSPVFRRGLYEKNNWAPRFIDLFWEFENSNLESFIALDTDRVRVNVDDRIYIEADTWYGAPFEQEISLIPDCLVHLRPPNFLEKSYLSFFFANAYALDILWTTKEKIKTFQSLEFKTEEVKIETKSNTFFPARYIHAEYDLESNKFRHFDGAIQYFSEEEYYLRRDSNFNYNFKESKKIKAYSEKSFKFNGPIDIDLWTEFSSHFYTGNPLIHEYFTGQYPKHIVELLEKIKARKNT